MCIRDSGCIHHYDCITLEGVPVYQKFIFPFFTSPVQGLICLALGSAITGIILAVIKKPVTEADEKAEENLGQELSDEALEEIDIEIM